MKIKKIINYFRDVNTLKKVVGYSTFSDAVKSQISFDVVNKFENSKILVLSPHPDDDILGCGGTLRLLKQAESEIRIIYLTDGQLGFNDNKKRAAREREELSRRREQEAKKAAASLGISDLIFWRYKDSSLALHKTNQRLMVEQISGFKPDMIFAPSFLDNNPDHMETAKILAEALRSIEKYNPQVYSYEIWSPVFANKLVVIDSVAADKFSALKFHESQMKSRNYLNAVRGLNRYRAGMFSVGEYAEGFFVSNKNLYLKLFDLINRR